LVEFRKAVKQTAPGDIIEIKGTDATSKNELPIAIRTLKLELLGVEEEGGTWTIRVRR
jgi:TusA-related sulfurtransferase